MNDLERDLREVLDEDARRVPTPASAPKGLARSAHRRQAVFVGVVGLAGAAVLAGIVAGGTTLLSMGSGPEPAALGPTTSGTMNGITIAYPRAWDLIDPDTAGLNGSPMMGESPLPRMVLALAPTEAPETFGCPGLAARGDAAPLLMTIQEGPLAPNGPASTPWPVELQPMSVDTSEGRCYPDWEFLRAGWTASGRTFEARVGFAPQATAEEREALNQAFASMRFAAGAGPPTSVVLDSGTIGGETYELIATSGPDGLELTLQGAASAAGSSGGQANANHLALVSQDIGGTRLVFGAVPAEAVRVVRTDPRFSTRAEYPVIDVPDGIDPTANAFMAVGGDGSSFEAVDADGNVIAHGSLGPEPAPTEAALEDGTHFGFVRSVDVVAGGTIEFDLAYFLSGEDANAAYHEAGGTGSVPNDYFVVNDNPMLRTLTLAPDVRLRLLDWNHCCDTFFDGDLEHFAEAVNTQSDVNDGDLIYRGLSQWWITVKDGVVTEIEEQYTP